MKLDKSRLILLNDLMTKLGYQFKDIDLLNSAFVHRSYINENRDFKFSNERLEFLGDSVLELVITEDLYNSFKKFDEGFLTKLRSKIVCEDSFAFASNIINLGYYLLLGKGEESFGGRSKKSILADTFEALFGAIYLDGGIVAVEQVFRSNFLDLLKNKASDKSSINDYKSSLQEHYHKNTNLRIRYRVDREVGPDHKKIFYVSVLINDKVIGSGAGSNKKQAEQSSAKNALVNLGVIYE